MFEYLYLNRVAALIQEHPKEIITAIAAYVAVSEIQGNIFKVKMAKIQSAQELQTAQINLECEKIRLETAKVEAQNRIA